MSENLLIVDCQYDFIDGTLACEHAEDAVQNIIDYVNANPDINTFYSADWHNLAHCSFKVNNKGGTWPVHCVAKTHGSELHKNFHRKILNLNQQPDKHKNVYFKGCDDNLEQYSAFDAKNEAGDILNQHIKGNVTIVGIASEFCVRESALAFLDAGVKVKILADALAWVNRDEHEKNLADLESRGAEISR